VTPNGYKAGTLYSVIPNTTLGDLSVTRATTATRVNSSGLIQSVASNVPRLDYTNGSCPSILVEPQRTNLLTWSEDFTNESWGLEPGNSVSSNTIISPDGNLTADTLTATAGNDINFYKGSFSLSGEYSFSFFLKNNGTNLIDLYVFKIGTGFASRGQINFSAETFTTSLGTGKIIKLINGWYKVTITNNYTLGDYTFGLLSASNVGVRSVYIWGAQLEEGSYATSYIPTTSASVTRNTDVISKTGISSLIGQTEGTLYAEIYANQAGGQQNWFEINDGSLDNWIFLGKEGNKIRGYIRTNSTNHFDNTSFSITNNAPMKVALAYKSGNYALYINGTQIASGTSSFTISNTISVAGFNYTISTGDTSSFKVTALWKTRLTNTQLATLTTI
jgi:hypothetical protein